jgi:hypothetical protein
MEVSKMVNKTDFSAEEWKQIVTAPQLASLHIALASPSGPVGIVQEMMAITLSIVEAIQKEGDNALVDAVAADFKEKAERREKIDQPTATMDLIELKAQCLQACRDLASLLSQKASTDAEAYKRWIYQIARRSAEAAREGGLLGFGGEKVSSAETTALAEVATALGITV